MHFMLAGTSRNDWRGLSQLIIRSIKGGSRDFVQGVGDRADQLVYTVACGLGDGMKFNTPPPTKIAQCFEACAIGSSVELRGHHDQRLFRKRFAESRQP